MFTFSKNYQLRQYYLQEQLVPTQSMIKRIMSSNLAAILFKSLDPKLKILAGLETPLKGGGKDWYVSPNEILVENRSVLKPLDHEVLTKINHLGFIHLGSQILIAHSKDLMQQKRDMLRTSDNDWKNTVETTIQEHWNNNAQLQAKINTEYIKYVFDLFSAMYRTSLSNIEMGFHEGVIKDIKKAEEEARLKMKQRYYTLCKAQAILMYHEISAKLKMKKARLKARFIEHFETCRTETSKILHDLNVDKHVVEDKWKIFLEYQKLACQTYVYLKEKEKCFKEMEESKQEHRKYAKDLTEASTLLNFEANLAEQKERKLLKSNSIWLKKISCVVKNFQMFVSYCLNALPDHAEFFINMEKLMLLQVNEALEDPSAKSIIEVDEEQFHKPVGRPEPFYLFCDKGYKTKVEQNLSTKQSGTFSASEVPVMIINKRCLYAACDNFEQYTNKIKEFIHGHRGDDTDFKDDLVYEHLVPVKYTKSQQLSEIKLESSLLQVLQQEMAHMQTDKNKIRIKCNHCELPWCSCHNEKDSLSNIKKEPPVGRDTRFSTSPENSRKTFRTCDKSTEQAMPLIPSQLTNNTAGPSANLNRLEHVREPKLDKYMRYTEPRRCGCVKSTKKHLAEHLPAYMRNMSMFDALELPNYEPCSRTTLKKLVKQAKAQTTPPSIVPISSKTKDMCTQCSDEQFDLLCKCFSHSNPDLFEPVKNDDQFFLGNVSPSYMTTTLSSFAVDRAHSLRQLIEDAPELKDLFNKKI